MFLRNSLRYFALCTVAVSQPILDLYGKNLTVFSAAKMGPTEILFFLAIVVFVPTLVLMVIDLLARFIGRNVHEATHSVLMWSLFILVALLILRTLGLDNDYLVYFLAPLLAVAAVVVYRRFTAVGSWLSWMSALAIPTVGLFLLQAQPLLLGTEPALAKATIGDKETPVLFMLMDELPLFSLLDASGNINAERFPGFAELQKSATWYRNNLAASNFTHQAIPATLGSRVAGRHDAPVVGVYKHNIFTLLGGVTTIDGIEPVTSLCTRSVCASAKASTTSFSFDRIGQFIEDAGVVYAQRALPARTRARFPDTARGWGGFANVVDAFRGAMANGPLSQANNMVVAAKKLTSSDGPQVSVVHSLIPHTPWKLTPDLKINTDVYYPTLNPESEGERRLGYQRYLYQLAGADQKLLTAINTLKGEGIWDESLVILVADHGVSFEPDVRQRVSGLRKASQIEDLYRVPLFVKYPGQSVGAVSDCPSTNLDLLPTVADVLQVQHSWKFEGESLANGKCPSRSTRTIHSSTGQVAEVSTSFTAAMERSTYYATLVPNVGDAASIARAGGVADVIGTRIKATSESAYVSLLSVDRPGLYRGVTSKQGSRSGSLVTGGITTSDVPQGTHAIVRVDGVAAGSFDVSGWDGPHGFAVIIDYTMLSPGDHVIDMVVRTPDGVYSSVSNYTP